MMKRFFGSFLIALIPVIALMFLYWVGGREFVRSQALEQISVASMLCFFGAFSLAYFCPSWDTDE